MGPASSYTGSLDLDVSGGGGFVDNSHREGKVDEDNPNSTGRGQSWPCWLWRQFPNKILICQIFFNWPVPAETSCESFWTSDMTSKNDVLMSILTFIRQKLGRGDILPPPPFRLVLLSIQITRGREKSRWALVRSTVQRQSTFQSVSGHGLRRVRGVAGSQPGPLSLSFFLYSWRRTVLGRFPKPQRSMTHYADTGRGEFTPRESEVKTDWTPVLNVLPGPRLI